jgi:predicted site-specific integrase-resolvase
MTRPLPPDVAELMRPEEVAAAFAVSVVTVRAWARAGYLTVVRTPTGRLRYRKDEVQARLGRT